MSDIQCPYCEAEQEINHDDGYGYTEGELHNQTCRSCNKTFAFTTQISFYYEAQKAPCLNDGEHLWKAVRSSHYPNFKRCEHCGEEKRGDFVDPAK